VITWDNHDLTPGKGTPKLLEERSSSGERGAPGPVAQLQDIAEQDEPIDVGKRLDEGRPWLRAAQDVSAGGGPEVEIRDN
jgi:hypothetical protein